ncbi:MAG: hypothetical protein JXR84_20600 [Anaerolineae bacterium]|nr:hypothetical protein [Anaerolineae bacterium]
MERMSAFRSSIADPRTISHTLWSYRLNEEPFYFKFCEQVRPTARDESLVPGIILCAPHLEEFLDLPEAREPGKEPSISYRNCPRYFNNTEFVQLARSGWIGGNKHATALLQKVLEANQRGGRSAMLAVIDTPKLGMVQNQFNISEFFENRYTY